MRIGKFLYLLAPLATSMSGSSAYAQATFATYGVADWSSIIPSKRVEFQTYRSIILSDGTLDAEEKAKRVTQKYTAIETEVRQARTALYEAFSDKVGVGNSATKGSSGGDPKVSEAKCRGSNYPNMYTREEWAKGAYKSGGDDAGPGVIASGNPVGDNVTDDGNQVCAIRLKQSGKGRKVAYAEATFKVRPAAISALVDAEMGPIMTEISKSPI